MFNSPVVPRTRPPSESRAIHILAQLLAHDISPAIRTGVISRWLKRYPFPFLSEEGKTRKDTVMTIRMNCMDDADMDDVITRLATVSQGKLELWKHGLYGDERPAIEEDYKDTWMIGAEDTAGVLGWDLTTDEVHRRMEVSEEEAALRRRRREAMVLSEVGQPLGQENIIQRPVEAVPGGAEIEEQLRQLSEEVEREDRDAENRRAGRLNNRVGEIGTWMTSLLRI